MRAARAALAVIPDDETPPPPIGDNNPPAPDPFETVRVHLDGLVMESRNWADGTAIKTPAQADEISFLIDQLRKGAKTAEDLRKKIKQPHLDAGKAVDDRFKPILTATDRAIDATKRTLGVWLAEKEREKAAAETAAAAAAQAAARQAALARALADKTDLESQERADEATATADELAKGAKKIAAAPVAATGGARAMTLRSYFSARIVDRRETLKHYAATQPEKLEAFLLTLAQADVNRGLRTIPGVEVDEDRRPV
jgi:hypothetical protein